MSEARNVVVFVGDARPPALTAEHERALAPALLDVHRVGERDAGALLERWLRDDRPPPAAVVFGISLQNPLALARMVHQLAPLLHLVFLIMPERSDEFRLALNRAPLIGTHWNLIEAGDERIAEVVEEAARSTQRRLTFRASMDRINERRHDGYAGGTAVGRRLVVTTNYLASVLEHADDAILAVDHDDTIASWNRGAARLFGLDAVEALGRCIGQLVGTAHAEALLALVHGARAGTPVVNHEMVCQRADGGPFHAEVTLVPVEDEAGAIDSVSVVARDVTERRRHEAEIEALNRQLAWRVHDLHRANDELEATQRELLALNQTLERQATTDALTGLKNRIVFQNSLIEMIAVSERQGTPLSVLLVDIDHFKRVNDTRGHQEGDRVLRAVATALAGHVREQDIVARFGGEEFAVLLPNTGLADAVAVGEGLRFGCQNVVDVELDLTVSVGVASFVRDDTDVTLIGRADEALYASKERGRNRVTAARSPSETEPPERP
jgi:diguanylate cyclase (GGDEF)-like protein/PAS domain S-box-containing protein